MTIIPFILALGLQSAPGEVAGDRLPGTLGDEAFSVLTRFFEYDRGARLDARTMHVDTMEVYRLEKFVINGADGRRLPGYISIPRVRRAPYPVVLLVHDLGGTKDDWWARESMIRGGTLTRRLLATGHAVVMVDLPGHGERNWAADYEPVSKLAFRENQTTRLRDLLFQSVRDQRRVMDYLENRKDLDARRIGISGYGYGGLVSMMTATADDRLSSSNTLAAPMNIPPVALYSAQHFAPRLGTKPVYVIVGEQDPSAPERAVKDLFRTVQPGKKEIVFLQGDYRLSERYIELVVWWHKKHLRKGEALPEPRGGG